MMSCTCITAMKNSFASSPSSSAGSGPFQRQEVASDERLRTQHQQPLQILRRQGCTAQPDTAGTARRSTRNYRQQRRGQVHVVSCAAGIYGALVRHLVAARRRQHPIANFPARAGWLRERRTYLACLAQGQTAEGNAAQLLSALERR